jgi:hypothetical protein
VNSCFDGVSMSEMGQLRVSMVESNLPELDLENKSYSLAFERLKSRGLEVLYESRTSVLTTLQRELFWKTVNRASNNIRIFLDPIVVSFAIHDACDLSDTDYAWLDLEGEDEVGNSAWTKGGNEGILDISEGLLKKHLEKYILDAYDRHTREDMVRVWEAGLKLLQCPICGESSLERKPIILNNNIIRSWVCSDCEYHVTVQTDVLNYLKNNGATREGSIERQ